MEEIKSPKEKRMKIIVPIIAVSVLILLFFIKSQNPNFGLKYVLIIAGFILIFSGIAFWGAEITDRFNKIKNKDGDKNILPEPVSSDVLWQKAKYSLTNEIYRDHIKKIEKVVNHSVGKNKKSLVVEFQVKTLNNSAQTCHIILNANYPNRMPTVLFEPTIYELNRAIQSMSFDPEDPANEEEIVVKNDITGITATTKKKTFTKNKTEEKKKSGEPLI